MRKETFKQQRIYSYKNLSLSPKVKASKEISLKSNIWQSLKIKFAATGHKHFLLYVNLESCTVCMFIKFILGADFYIQTILWVLITPTKTFLYHNNVKVWIYFALGVCHGDGANPWNTIRVARIPVPHKVPCTHIHI